MKHPIPVQASRYMDCMYCTQWAGVIFKPKGLLYLHGTDSNITIKKYFFQFCMLFFEGLEIFLKFG